MEGNTTRSSVSIRRLFVTSSLSFIAMLDWTYASLTSLRATSHLSRASPRVTLQPLVVIETIGTFFGLCSATLSIGEHVSEVVVATCSSYTPPYALAQHMRKLLRAITRNKKAPIYGAFFRIFRQVLQTPAPP